MFNLKTNTISQSKNYSWSSIKNTFSDMNFFLTCFQLLLVIFLYTVKKETVTKIEKLHS